jgi:serine/threonine protein kinase
LAAGSAPPFTLAELTALSGNKIAPGDGLAALEFVETLSTSPTSIVVKYTYQDSLYVLKRTLRSVCQEETLKQLAGQHYYYGTASIACPMNTWAIGKYVWELRPFIAGVSLYRLILMNKYRINGRLIGILYAEMVRAIAMMHESDVLHRDVRPQNMILSPSGEIALVDCTFCCRSDGPQVPVANEYYTAREQRAGRAVASSDWYSLAATVYFLVNGSPPPIRSEAALKSGLRAIDLYGFGPSPLFSARAYGLHEENIASLFAALLNPDVDSRPSRIGEIELSDHTIVPEPYDTIGVLDMDGEHFLVVERSNYHVLMKPDLAEYLLKARAAGHIHDEQLRQDIDLHLGGSPPWRHDASRGR